MDLLILESKYSLIMMMVAWDQALRIRIPPHERVAIFNLMELTLLT